MNRLAEETSAYLLQHKDNPVDWYAWGPDAFARARAEDRPIFLSVGYSACHWCHVMEHESFEDPETARLLNEHFVCVKVDREERPDVDQIYMQAVQSMTGHGGWPMSVFLTADGVPFYGGTYFPPTDRHGLPAFPRLLRAIAEAWQTRRAEVVESGRSLVEQLGQTAPPAGPRLLTADLLGAAFQALAREFDDRDGGLGQAPKFPQPMIWEFVLRFWKRTGQPRAREMVTTTLTRMARGGVYDQLGGGFHRYSVDGRWLVPHFEKMLYDQGQLASLYLHAYQAFGDDEYRRVAEETLDYLLREMTDPRGGFYAAQDADSEGEEGKFFLWTADELRTLLGSGTPAIDYWGVDGGPNFEGRNILYVAAEPDPGRIAGARATLLAARARRVPPGRDDKVLAGWNALACRAFAEAGRVLGRPDYVAAAVRNAEFVLGAMQRDGWLLRCWAGGRAKLKGYLEDYAPRRLRGHVRPALARRVPSARRRDPPALLGRRGRRLLRREPGPRAARGAAAKPLRQRRAVRQLGGGRGAPPARGLHRRGALRDAGGAGAPRDGGLAVPPSRGLRALPRRAGLPPRPRRRGRADRARDG